MKNKMLLVLDEDKDLARKRIIELEDSIQSLGSEFYDVFNQSSETWHDNAPFEAVRDRQSVMDAERQNLKAILRNSNTSIPHQNRSLAGIGAMVYIKNTQTAQTSIYYIAGDWTYRAGQKYKDSNALIISAQAPLATKLTGVCVGDVFEFHSNKYIVEIIKWSV